MDPAQPSDARPPHDVEEAPAADAGPARGRIGDRLRDAVAPWLAPAGVFPWLGLVAIAVLLAHPLTLAPLLGGSAAARTATTYDMVYLLENLAVFGAAVLLKYEWRLSRNRMTGWLSAGLTVWSIHNLPLSLLAVADSPYGGFVKVNGVTSLATLVVLLGMLLLAARTRIRVRMPLLVGATLGIGLGELRLVLAVDRHPGPIFGTAGVLAFEGLVLALTIVILVQLMRARSVVAWARPRMVMAIALLSATAQFRGPGGYRPTPIVEVLLGVLGASLLLATAAGMLRTSFRANSRWLVSLAHRAASAEAAVRHGKERMHELNATIAGVTQASRLLLQDGGPTGARRARLQGMVDAEMARLERLLSQRSEATTTAFAVDDVIRPLVMLQRTLGQPVRWVPSSAHAVGLPDDLGEVVHNLLVNASRHARGALTTVTSRVVGGTVEIRVADTGPGIDPTLRDSLFTWGAHRPGSPGQGIGLQLAQRLMTEQGGDLRLAPSRRQGTEFVISLPAAPAARADTSVADPPLDDREDLELHTADRDATGERDLRVSAAPQRREDADALSGAWADRVRDRRSHPDVGEPV